jgi:glycosyltransferase involved in cell wall biosynthesis
MKRILFADHTPFAGGAELVLAEHIRHLDRTRFTPLVACTPTVPALVELYRAAGAEVHLTPMPRLRTLNPLVLPRVLAAARAFRRLVRRERVDLVVSNTSRAAYLSSLALLGTGVPLVWWVRDFLYGRTQFRLFRRIPRRIIAVSDAIRQFYAPGDDRGFAVVHVGNSLYRRLAEVADEQVRRERERWGFSADDLVIGFMGRLVAEKGIEDLVAAVEALHARHPRVKLLVVGTGRDQEGDVEGAVRESVRRKGLGCVVFAGFQDDEALYYRVFDLFVLSTRVDDAYATSVVQAMMAGRPVVATATGGTPEIVRDGETGLLVPPGDPEALAAALARLVEEPELAKRLASAGQELVMANNREEQTTARAEDLYRSVLDG